MIKHLSVPCIERIAWRGGGPQYTSTHGMTKGPTNSNRSCFHLSASLYQPTALPDNLFTSGPGSTKLQQGSSAWVGGGTRKEEKRRTNPENNKMQRAGLELQNGR